MSEAEQISRTATPITRDSLVADLLTLGVKPGETLLVHSSLRALGWVNGGAVAVVQALLDAIGPDGTLVMPAHSTDLTDPRHWQAPPVPADWQQTIRDTMPAFEPAITPTRQMGRIAELFRTWPGALRSGHPALSFAALGPLAAEITGRHDLADPFGEHSPLGALYELGARTLLIGVGFDRCTALHFAERRAFPDAPQITEGAPILVDGRRQWVQFETPSIMDSDAFLPVGLEAIERELARTGPLGAGEGILADMKSLVDHAFEVWTQAGLHNSLFMQR